MLQFIKRFFAEDIDSEAPGFVLDESINLYTCLTCGWSCPYSETETHECPESYLSELCRTGLMTRRVCMRRKRFDRKLYKKYDALAKGYARKELEHLGLVVEDHPQKTKVDLIVKDGDEEIFYVECEIKTALDKPFPYETLQLPHRKEKFCGLDKPTLFMLFSSNGDKCFCVWDSAVLKSNLAEVSNKYMVAGEFFFQVPLANTNRSAAEALMRDWRRHGADGETDPGT